MAEEKWLSHFTLWKYSDAELENTFWQDDKKINGGTVDFIECRRGQ